jgi:hypothetical protein
MVDIEKYYGKKIFLDTAPLIYFLEKHIEFSALVFPFFKAHAENKLIFATSVVTVGEVLVQPFRDKNDRLIAAYSQILKPSADFEITAVTYDIVLREDCDTAGGLRVQ